MERRRFMNDLDILCVEDECAIQTLLRFGLEQSGYAVRMAGNIAQAQQAVNEKLPDVLLIDWMLPDQSGVEWIAQLRANRRTRDLPMILLTARSADTDKEYGLNQGADDYLTKPFSPRELTARIKALLRRRAPQKGQSPINIGDVCIDPEAQRLSSGSLMIECSVSEFKLLHFFATHPNRTYSRRELLDYVWGDHVYVEERSVDVQIGRLRKLLEPTHLSGSLNTVRGSGYRFDVPE